MLRYQQIEQYEERKVPSNTQNHKSSNEELDYHPTMCSPTLSHDGILALLKNINRDIEVRNFQAENALMRK